MELASDSGELLTVVGEFPSVTVGETLSAEGEFTSHRDYGRQFSAETYSFSPPESEDALVAFLGAGILKGTKRDVLHKIVKEFGTDTLSVLENEPEKISKIVGVTKEKAVSAGKRYREVTIIRNTVSALAEIGVKPYIAARLYKIYGSAAVKAVYADPYILCNEYIDVPFEEADEIASKVGIDAAAPCRVKAAVEYVLFYNTKNGHTFLPYESLISVAAELIGCDDVAVADAVTALLNAKVLQEKSIANLNAVYLYKYGNSEEYIAKRLIEMAKTKKNAPDEKLLESVEKSLSIKFADLQKKAITEAARCGVFVITGGPGTGKTTALLGLIKLLEAQNCKTVLAAPTGRAAKRMTEVTGTDAQTIHRLLETGFDAARRPVFRKNEKNPIDADVVIIDEASMVDTLVFEALLRAVKPTSALILVGDIDQLPPVGAGAVLRDIIKSEVFDFVALNEIFRQAQDSLIVVNAHTVNRGEYPEFDRVDSDFFFVKRKEKEEIFDAIGKLVSKSLPSKFGYDPIDDIQVITPTKKNELGTRALNGLLRELLNPPSQGKKEYLYVDRLFREGDKVMQVRNNYDLVWVVQSTGEIGEGIYNGDIGRVVEIDAHNKFMRIDFEGRMTEVAFENLFDVEPAYAITVHKSQGNEFPCVVMPMAFGNGRLATRNLLYTAITRARRTMVMVGLPEAMCRMVDNNKELKRFSGLRYILQGMVDGGTV